MDKSKATGWIAALSCCALMMLTACESQELVNVRNMSIGSPPIGEIPNGAYRGAYAYGSFEYVVEVSIADGRIMGIKAIANRDTSHARSAEGVFPRIIDAQTPDVDAVTGATTTSKALMKAVENALAGAGQ